jgi:hypothetical protein
MAGLVMMVGDPAPHIELAIGGIDEGFAQPAGGGGIW